MSKEQWDERFSDENFVYGTEVNDFILEQAGRLPAKCKIGCFAEGEGRNAVYLASQGHEVEAYDQSSTGLEKMYKLAQQHRVEVKGIQKDLINEKVESERYDAAVMVFGHVPKSGQPFLIENILQSVKTGGIVMFEVYSEKQLEYGTGGPPSQQLLYTPSDVLSWIEHQNVLHFYYGEAVRNEGERHNGLGHVIQVVLQKK
ncbi:class I SAM-dependent methyltransferase [Halobacillus campisalis]|uniref:Class I SAM-dependent methyltransferase n=1 Tax=Halobacillus campisalis TaxID=435909 RepID=A0ABW2K3Y6_9BACI|nr:class I SAM-dependent methyltransferase [Halobacillus campisalis]